MTSMAAKEPTAPGVQRMFQPPEWRWVQTGPVGWWLRGPWDATLLGPEGLRLEEWRREGRLTTVKSGPHRVVYRVDLPEGAIYVKHYLVPDYRAMWRQWFRRGKGRNEGKRSEVLAAIGVPTIHPIALGEQRKRNFLFENYLITWEIPGTIPLDEFLEERLDDHPEPLRSQIRQRLATSLAVLTARLHNAGMTHIDFHPGNILVRLNGEEMPVLTMIDLDALRKNSRLSWSGAQQNLALLDHYFWLRSSRSDRHRFLKAYLESRSEPVADARRFAAGIESSTQVWAERLWRRWGRRCRSTNKYFQVYKGHVCWSIAARDLDPSEVESLLADPDAPFSRPQTVMLKNSRTSTVAETTMLVGGQPTRVVYKRFNRKKWIDPWLNLVRPSRAWRSWQAGQHLASRGIPTPRNLAFLARKRAARSCPLSWFLPHETYLVTVKQDNAMTLAEYVRKVLPTLDQPALRDRSRRLNLALAHLVRALHERSLSHRDLKTSNILVHLDCLETSEFLSLIDLVGVRLMSPVPQRRRIQNLARLSVSLAGAAGRTRTETLRFLRAYLPWGLSPLSDWKSVWKSTERAVMAKRARNQRRGRPLS
ncbi:MAG: phosphotransferase [Planctomycetaceae bacterium]|nr:phosphotransferase [Planctomycetaceae bacterium]MBV8312435.1 phosphotransferase [Planctomycetaceae bacterium]